MPPNNGPNIGPMLDGIVTQLKTWLNPALGMIFKMTDMATGLIIAPPKPCIIRPAVKMTKLGAIPQIKEPNKKSPKAHKKTGLGPKRCVNQLLIGINKATDNRYPVMANFNISGLTCKSEAMEGNAVNIMVASSDSMNRAIARI